MKKVQGFKGSRVQGFKGSRVQGFKGKTARRGWLSREFAHRPKAPVPFFVFYS